MLGALLMSDSELGESPKLAKSPSYICTIAVHLRQIKFFDIHEFSLLH